MAYRNIVAESLRGRLGQGVEMTGHRRVLPLLLVLTLTVLVGCAPMTPAQQEAAAFRKSCEPNPLADPERCYVFINTPGG